MTDKQAIETARRASTRAASVVRRKMERGLGLLATIAATAPFFGLLGTALGIINSFKGCGCEKSTMFAALTGSLSEAMIQAAWGILIAVWALWCYRILSARLEWLDVEMETATLQMMNSLSRMPTPHRLA